MNYRHIYHAGNRCDVAKHAVLTLLLGHLRAKDKGFCVLDSHAGTALYDLNDPRAAKTAEADQGIRALLNAPRLPELAAYYQALARLNPLWDGKSAEGFRVYGGSPLLALAQMRTQDRLILCELHEDDASALRASMPDDKRVQIHNRDGYTALPAFLPPPEKRGLVLIDPPFEAPDEFGTLAAHVAEAHRRWPTGVFMLWYPVKERPAIWAFQEKLIAAGIGNMLAAEFVYEAETRADRLNGSGQIIINPPWKLDEELAALFPALHTALATAYTGDKIHWLTPRA